MIGVSMRRPNLRRAAFVLLLAAVVLGAVFAQPAAPAAAQSGKQVWAFYMGFWGGSMSWDWQADVLTDRPAIGPYDSRDPNVAAAQIDQAKSAGIDGFIVSWFGLGDGLTTTPVLNNMLDRAAERGFGVAAAVDVFNNNFNRNADELVNSLNYLVHDRANHPGYLRYHGKPVIFFAFQGRSGFSAADWQAIRNRVDPDRNTVWIAEGVNGCCTYGGAMDGMYAFNLAWANGSGARFLHEKTAAQNAGASLYIPTVHPGWDESKIAARDGRPNPTSPRGRAGGQFLTNSWNGAAAAGTDVVLVVSWNEFMENSHIEPSQNYGSQSLDILRPLIASWKGAPGAAPAPAAPAAPAAGSGQVLEATTGLNVRTGPGTSHTRIGRIAPGETYSILGEQNGWYAISFGGQTGYVSGQYVRVSQGSATAPGAAPASGTLEAVTGLNVRTGPGLSHGKIGIIRPGTAYEIVGQQAGWYAINYNGQAGYVSGEYVRVH